MRQKKLLKQESQLSNDILRVLLGLRTRCAWIDIAEQAAPTPHTHTMNVIVTKWVSACLAPPSSLPVGSLISPKESK